MKKIIYLLLSILVININAQNTSPVVSNVRFHYNNANNNQRIFINYDVYDAEQSMVNIYIAGSTDEGETWNYNVYINNLHGDIGNNIAIGQNKQIYYDRTGSPIENFIFRVFADDGVADGSPCPENPTVEYMGQTYHTLLIGTQCWLKENLNVGIMINGTENQTNNGIIEKYCYDNDSVNCETYGGLYQWGEAVQYLYGASNNTSPDTAFTENVQGICPDGWHLTTLNQHNLLVKETQASSNKLKLVGLGSGTGIGNNISGFSSLLCGYRDINGNFVDGNINSFYWWSRGYGCCNAWYLGVRSNHNVIVQNTESKRNGFSVRCIKDITE